MEGGEAQYMLRFVCDCEKFVYKYFWSRTTATTKTQKKWQRASNKMLNIVADGIVIAFPKQWIGIAFRILDVCSIVCGMKKKQHIIVVFVHEKLLRLLSDIHTMSTKFFFICRLHCRGINEYEIRNLHLKSSWNVTNAMANALHMHNAHEIWIPISTAYRKQINDHSLLHFRYFKIIIIIFLWWWAMMVSLKFHKTMVNN